MRLCSAVPIARQKKTDKTPEYLGHGSRLLVRDAYMSKSTVKWLKDSEYTDMPFTEQKYENTIDRKTGTTVKGGVRNQERVPAGAKFAVEFVINIFGDDTKAKKQEIHFLAVFNLGIKLLENDYLGGSGSRGYGQVKFKETSRTEFDVQAAVTELSNPTT